MKTKGVKRKLRLVIIGVLASLTICVANKYRYVTHSRIVEDGKVWGIDISHHQDQVDWKQLSEQKPHFIFLKVTEGATHSDKLYKENYERAREMDIHVGSYHFFTYRSPGKQQATHFLKSALFKNGDLPLVLDAEYSRNMPSAAVVTRELISFLKTVKQHTGYKPIIYCDYDYYKQFLKGKLKSDYLLWICDYRDEPNCNWTFWQTTDKFKVAGVRGFVDLNIFNGSKSELKKLLK